MNSLFLIVRYELENITIINNVSTIFRCLHHSYVTEKIQVFVLKMEYQKARAIRADFHVGVLFDKWT